MWMVVQTTDERESAVIEAISNAVSKVVDGHNRWNDGVDVIRRSLIADLRSRTDAEWIMGSTMDAISTDGVVPTAHDQMSAIDALCGKSVEATVGRLASVKPSIYVVRQ